LGAEQPLKHSQLVARRNAMGIVTAITPEQRKLAHDIASYVGDPAKAGTYRAPFMPSGGNITEGKFKPLRFSRPSGA